MVTSNFQRGEGKIMTLELTNFIYGDEPPTLGDVLESSIDIILDSFGATAGH